MVVVRALMGVARALEASVGRVLRLVVDAVRLVCFVCRLSSSPSPIHIYTFIYILLPNCQSSIQTDTVARRIPALTDS